MEEEDTGTSDIPVGMVRYFLQVALLKASRLVYILLVWFSMSSYDQEMSQTQRLTKESQAGACKCLTIVFELHWLYQYVLTCSLDLTVYKSSLSYY